MNRSTKHCFICLLTFQVVVLQTLENPFCVLETSKHQGKKGIRQWKERNIFSQGPETTVQDTPRTKTTILRVTHSY